MDANIRQPVLGAWLQCTGKPGYTDVVMDYSEARVSEAVQSTTVANLSVIALGSGNGNPWQLYRSENAKRLAATLRDQFDYVLWDVGSVVAYTDLINLAPVLDGAYLVFRAYDKSLGGERKIAEQLQASHVPLLGVVITRAPAGFTTDAELSLPSSILQR